MLLRILLVALAIIAVVVGLRSLRGERKEKSRKPPARRPGGLIGVGAMELQKHLQPDRKVEIIQEEAKDRDRVHPEHRPASPADGDPEDR